MSGFNLPVKEIIVNDDAQVVLLEDDGTAYAALDASPSAGGFILEGFLQTILGSQLVLLAAATRIRKQAASAAAKETKTFVLTDAAGSADSIFRIVWRHDEMSAEFQNRDLEKRYQISNAWAAVDTLGAAIVATINADKYAPVTAGYVAGTDTLTLTAKEAGVHFDVYSSDITLPTATTTVVGTLGAVNYSTLKNVNWAKNLDYDRNHNYHPQAGVSYNAFYFEFDSDSVANLGDAHVPGELHGKSRQGIMLYVKEGLTLETKLDLLVTDMNV